MLITGHVLIIITGMSYNIFNCSYMHIRHHTYMVKAKRRIILLVIRTSMRVSKIYVLITGMDYIEYSKTVSRRMCSYPALNVHIASTDSIKYHTKIINS